MSLPDAVAVRAEVRVIPEDVLDKISSEDLLDYIVDTDGLDAIKDYIEEHVEE